MTDTRPHCFTHIDRHGIERSIFFVAYRGKSLFRRRWRFDLFYTADRSVKHHEHSRESADRFLARCRALMHADYAALAQGKPTA